MFTVSFYMLLSVLERTSIPDGVRLAGEITVWLALALTLGSAVHYLWRNRLLIQRLGM